jgi:hypothetical protein
MVTEFKRKIGTLFQCEICGFGYLDLDTAERCEEYCDIHGSWSIAITDKAAYRPLTHTLSAHA